MKQPSLIALALLTFLYSVPAVGEERAAPDAPDSTAASGLYDRPFITSWSRAGIGGYADLQFRAEREEGFATETSFVVKQVNLFVFASLHERIRFITELEIEDGGEEIVLELAAFDFDVLRGLSLRAGMLLSPIGRFNIAHDSPANAFVDRPLVATRVIPTTLSEPGAGIFGGFRPWSDAHVGYELYLVNGFGDGIAVRPNPESPLAPGTPNLIDNNRSPSIVGRVAFRPLTISEIAVSGHSGPYNRWRVEGLRLGPRRTATLLAVDGSIDLGPVSVTTEAARGFVELPAGDVGRRGERFAGLYGQAVWRFGESWLQLLPESHFGVGARYGFVDQDLEVSGDHTHRATVGVEFRPIADSVFKLDYQRDLSVDRDLNPVNEAALLAAIATYF